MAKAEEREELDSCSWSSSIGKDSRWIMYCEETSGEKLQGSDHCWLVMVGEVYHWSGREGTGGD